MIAWASGGGSGGLGRRGLGLVDVARGIAGVLVRVYFRLLFFYC